MTKVLTNDIIFAGSDYNLFIDIRRHFLRISKLILNLWFLLKINSSMNIIVILLLQTNILDKNIILPLLPPKELIISLLYNFLYSHSRKMLEFGMFTFSVTKYLLNLLCAMHCAALNLIYVFDYQFHVYTFLRNKRRNNTNKIL